MTAERLFELQAIDTAIDQLRLRLPRLPEVLASTACATEVAAWDKRAAELQTGIAKYEAAIHAAEQASANITTKRTRLEMQLKTVIAPREAEALMHEIATLNQQRSALDDDELAALEGLSDAEQQVAEHSAIEDLVRSAAATAAQAASTVTATTKAEISALQEARDAARPTIDPALLTRYDSMRAQLDGVAIAKLNDLRCEGCHIDMSRGEADDIKRLPADAFPECPNCGRLLAR